MVSPINPLVTAIPYRDGMQAISSLAGKTRFVFLDSSKIHADVGQFSYIGVDPFALLSFKDNQIFFNQENCSSHSIFDVLAEKLALFSLKSQADLPPFQGGVAGFFSYDLVRNLERLPEYACDDKKYPQLMLGFFDLVVSFDHQQKKAWVLSSGFPETDQNKLIIRAKNRRDWCIKLLSDTVETPMIAQALVSEDVITSNFTRSKYIAVVQQAIDYIREGDIFEVNLSQRFSCTLPMWSSPFDLYRRIRYINPAPFSAYIALGDTAIVSSSPERFLKLHNRKVETRPIKGTARRSTEPDEDQQLADALVASDKNRAENTMIVDLMRNDLSRVCLPNSVQVVKYCGLESYETVHHLVSVIEGTLEDTYQAVDLLKVAFPGGSITGAPKIRAMEIIEELEPTQRGPYCGSVGYIGFDGNMDTSILIRSYLIKNNEITFQVGGAVVLDSDPSLEYEETLLKANVLKRALTETLSTMEESHDTAH